MYSSWVDCALDVLATSPKQLDAIANLLQEPSAEFLRWSVLPYWPPPKPGEIKRYRKLLAFKAVKNLEYAAKGVSKARRFHHSVIHSDDVLIDVYLTQVSTAFPGAIFLLDYGDPQRGSAWKQVVRNGVTDLSTYHRWAVGIDWSSPDIFVPFRAEYRCGQPYGSMWNQWVVGLIAAADELRNERCFDKRLGKKEKPPIESSVVRADEERLSKS